MIPPLIGGNVCEADKRGRLRSKAQIKRVIVNLLSNAITYGFKETDVNIVLSETDSEIKCHIDNKACPIKQELLDDIFLKFKTAENAKFQKTQNGLGLYLSKQIKNTNRGINWKICGLL